MFDVPTSEFNRNRSGWSGLSGALLCALWSVYRGPTASAARPHRLKAFLRGEARGHRAGPVRDEEVLLLLGDSPNLPGAASLLLRRVLHCMALVVLVSPLLFEEFHFHPLIHAWAAALLSVLPRLDAADCTTCLAHRRLYVTQKPPARRNA
jgi:hypothetical protein